MLKYGLIGEKLSHSFSKKFFSEKFEKEGVDAVYLNYELNSIAAIKDVWQNKDVQGLNVTIPYKTAVIPFLDELTDEAREIGAVNTVIFKDGKRIGANTDAFGFHQMIKPFLLNTHHKALIIGNGGAMKAVQYVLKKIGLDVLVVARNPHEGEFHMEDLNEMMVKHCGIIVNTTPVGMYPNVNECIHFPFNALTADHLVVDLIYNPEQTLFLKRSHDQGAVTLNGETMLREQALRSWELWNNV